MQEISELDSKLDELEKSVAQHLGPAKKLRPLQRETLQHLAAGSHTFASLPTGYGKSLCYWAPAVAWGWRVWVVCPLVSLMEDQALACAAMGVAAVALHSGLDQEELDLREQQIIEGRPVVFLSPERLESWQENGRLKKWSDEGYGPDLLALDEMHCFEEWREFRKSYQKVYASIRRILSRGTLLLGLSASLSAKASDAWMLEFCESFSLVTTNLGRENLRLRIFPIEEDSERWFYLASLLKDKKENESILLYCSTRAECDDLARWLSSLGFVACTYHAGVPATLRTARSIAFRNGQLPFVCATSAFGMGIDFPRVSRVIHFSTPYDLESYWQEAGRAGRDGNLAFAFAFWRRSDIARAMRMSERQKGRYLNLWESWLAGGCRKRAVARALGVDCENCGACDHCDPQAAQQPNWLREICTLKKNAAWWTKKEAEGARWARGKIFPHGKTLDPIPSSVSVLPLSNTP